MGLPEGRHVPGCSYNPLPYYLVGDETFPLKTWLIIWVAICLHNYLHLTDNATYTPYGFVDNKDSTGNIKGNW